MVDGVDNVNSDYVKTGIKQILKKRIVITTTIGLIFTVLGLLKFEFLVNEVIWTGFFSPLFTALGTAIIAASIVGFIFADEDYMTLLKGIIVAVIFSPEVYRSQEQLMQVWRRVSLKLLAGVLPFSKEQAVELIENQFFSDERDYHFEDVECELNFKMNEATGMLTITQTISAALVIAPNQSHPVLRHYMTVEDNGQMRPTRLMLNGDMIKVNDYLTESENNENERMYTFEYPLKDKIDIDGDRRTVKYKRVVDFVQVFSDDPSLVTNLTRFVKGYSIEAKIPKGYKIKFIRFGTHSSQEPTKITMPNGVFRWELGKKSDLLLPGEAYILTLCRGDMS